MNRSSSVCIGHKSCCLFNWQKLLYVEIILFIISPCAVCCLLHIDNIDREKLQCLFDEFDIDRDGSINVNELEKLLVKLGVAPLTEMSKRSSASIDKSPKEAPEA